MRFRFATLLMVAAGAMLSSLLVGGSKLSGASVVFALFHPSAHTDASSIVWQLRFPRVCIAALVGASLGVAGAILQGMLRNPLVDPYLTGVSAGAAAAITVAIAIGIATPLLPALGFVAGLCTGAFVAALARRGTGIDVQRLILAGVSLSALFSAIVALVLTRLQQGGYAEAIIAWLAGSLAGRGWHELWVSVPYTLAGLALALGSARPLNALRLGNVRAASLGVNVDRSQWVILGAASLLTASAVSLSGIIGFVGLIVPHIARRTVGSDARHVVAASLMLGAALMILADAASRALLPPLEIPIGVLLAFVGVPAFLYVYLHSERASSWR